MRLLNFNELVSLPVRTKLVRIENGKEDNFEFIGLLPSNINYAIVGSGENVKTIHKNHFDNIYHGSYDPRFVGNKMIEQRLEDIESIKDIYLK